MYRLRTAAKRQTKRKPTFLYPCTATVPTAAAALKYGRLKNSPPDDLLLAENIMESLDEVGLSKNRGVKGGIAGNGNNYYVNKNTDMPSCLAEMGFITDDGDNALFDKNLQSYAAAIADAVETTLAEIKK